MKEALFYTKLQNGNVQCVLCPNNCIIQDGATGICGVRKNDNGKLLGLTKKWIIKYKQEAALVKKCNTNIFELLFNNGQSEKVGKLKPNVFNNIYSKIKRGNRTFIFENIVNLPGNWFSTLENNGG